MKVEIKEHKPPCRTVNLVDGDYVIAYNVRRDYAELIRNLYARANGAVI